MKKQFLIMVISFFIFACGGNAENLSEENINETTLIAKKKANDLAPEQADITEPEREDVVVIDEEFIVEKTTEIPKGKKAEAVTEEPKEAMSETEEKLVEVVEEVVVAPVKVSANHKAWNGVLKKNVASTGKVNYKGMKADLSKIKTYLLHLEQTPPTKEWSKNEKLAYWINLYNASTVYLIASNYPVSSITKINGGKPWDKKFVKSGSKVYSLNDIENTIVRPQFKDPRIHAALNCAAVSCPKLLNGAFLPATLNAQLDKQVRAWVNDSSKNKLSGNKVQISQIFDWYKVDFKGGVISFLNKYISTNVAVEKNAKISYLEYNWALNE